MSSVRLRRAAAALTAAVAVADVVAGTVLLSRSPRPPAHQAQLPPATAPRTPSTPTPTPSLSPSPTPTSAPVVHAQPDTLWIPSQRVRAPIDVCDIIDHELDPPHDVSRACFWAGGAHLSADAGTSVVAGHINWVGQGTGALGRIGQLHRGDVVKTTGQTGILAVWRVTKVWHRPKTEGIDASVFVGPQGPRRLYLITCGGTFDAADANYLDNIYVEAVPVVPARSASTDAGTGMPSARSGAASGAA